MKVFSFLFIGLSLIFQRCYGEEKLVKEGDAKSWYNRYVDTSNKGGSYEPWFNNYIESIDEENGVWVLTEGVECDQRYTISCVTINYHVDIKAKRTKCHNTTCSLQIFIYNGTEEFKIPRNPSGDVSGGKKQQMYLLNNFMKLHDVTFTENNKIETQSFNFSHNCCVDFSYNCSQIRFAIRARAIKGELQNMKVYFYYCKETLRNGVKLARTYAPSSGLKRVAVNCTSNAVSKYNESSFDGLCWYNGTWNIGNDTDCYCRPGYGMSGGCKRCLEGHYKSNISNEGCTSCPARSTSNSTNTACNCLEEKYRLKTETGVSSAPCYGFPSKVRNIKVEKSDSRGNITLSWEPPLEQGGLPRSLKYDVGCGDECELKFTPSKVNLTKTRVEISGLTPGHEYNFTVFSKNIISVLYSNGHLAFENKKFKLPRDPVKENTNDSSGIINIIIATTVAGVFLSIITIVLLVKYIRLKRASNLSTPFDTSLEAVDTPQKSLPIDQEEPGYETVSRVVREFYDDVVTNADNCKDAELYEEVGVPSVTHRTSGYKTYEEPKMSQENPGYTELDKNRLQGRNATDDSTYQKLQRQDSDYVIPAHERRESYEDIKMGGNLPGYEELDQSKREADDYTPLTKSEQKPELA